MPPNPLLRTALVLSATGIVSASSVRHAIAEVGMAAPTAVLVATPPPVSTSVTDAAH